MPEIPALTGYCAASAGHPFHGPHHDLEHGFPGKDDNQLFEQLLLEINQAGLSWLTVLKKRDGLRSAYAEFSIETVAKFGESDRSRLLGDAGIIRNRLKVDAAISNAKTILGIQEDFGSFSSWLDHHHPLPKPDWVKLFKKTFRFTGGEITGEFLMSTGYLPGAHCAECPIYHEILALNPPWLSASQGVAI